MVPNCSESLGFSNRMDSLTSACENFKNFKFFMNLPQILRKGK